MYIQIKLYSEQGFKPLFTTIEVDCEKYNANPNIFRDRGIAKICAHRHITLAHLRKWGFNKVSMREVPADLWAQDQQARRDAAITRRKELGKA